MMVCALAIDSLDELRGYVRRTLSEVNHLADGAFAIGERRLLRRGLPCGLMFSIRGPRLDTYMAVWEVERNSVFFYDCRGDRIQVTQLVDSQGLTM